MERKRKSYLLRKSDPCEQPKPKPRNNGEAVCSCNKVSAKSYDLQTQTVTFEDEFQPRKNKQGVFICPSGLKYQEDSQKGQDNFSFSEMDQDLEFYPVDDHPSPSTFAAWDAFLAGNQAFFREPPCLLPDPAFSYMDVIPEEDDLEALLESDTDDTGSSVSTVIDRFSRTSTANSSFSERCKGAADVTFDLQKVLSPFERLEKELDAEEPKDDIISLSTKEVQRGPIVVITNSSSCEDVHSAGEDDLQEEKTTKNVELQNNTELSSNVSELKSEGPSKEINNDISDCADNCDSEKSTSLNKEAPLAPSRTKTLNSIKNSKKESSKKNKAENQTSNSSPSSAKKKKSYQAPNVPPRMSKHLPARRTRSDPGSNDQPSRIPRPISNSSRPPAATTGTKFASKATRSPKLSSTKQRKNSESSKPTQNNNSTKKVLDSEDSRNNINGEDPHEVKHIEDDDRSVESSNLLEVLTTKSEETVSPKLEFEDNFVPEMNCCDSSDTLEDSLANSATTIIIEGNTTKEQREEKKGGSNCVQVIGISTSDTNPFRRNESNPFKNEVDAKNPFVAEMNPFDEDSEDSPILQPKGQITASLIPPPIPERLSLKSSGSPQKEKKDNDSDNQVNQIILNVVLPSAKENNEAVSSSEMQQEINNRDSEDLQTTRGQDSSEQKESQNPSNLPEEKETVELWLDKSLDSTSGPDPTINSEPESSSESRLDVLINNSDESLLSNPPEIPSSPPMDNELQKPQQRPIEDILQALDQLVLSTPREVEISIDWEARGPVNIREKLVVPSTTSINGSENCEMDDLPEDRKRDIETLLKEVDECLRMHHETSYLVPFIRKRCIWEEVVLV